MRTKKQIIDAIQLAIDDHKEAAGTLRDHEFVACLRDAMRIVEAAPTIEVPVALTKENT